MYTWEMIEFINKRNRYIGGDDLEQITSLNLNPQIKKIAYYEVYEYEKDGIRYKEHGIYKIEVKQSQILEGIPAQSIMNFAKEKNIDLIVTGSKIKTKMQRFLLDSVSKRVVENTKSDVFVIKNKIDEKNNTNK